MIFSKISCDALMVQSAPSSSPSSTLTLPSVTLTVHWPAPSMSKAYELFMSAVFDVSARDGSVSKNSCTVPGIYRSFSRSRRESTHAHAPDSLPSRSDDEGRDRPPGADGCGRSCAAGRAAAGREGREDLAREARRAAPEVRRER